MSLPTTFQLRIISLTSDSALRDPLLFFFSMVYVDSLRSLNFFYKL